MGKQLERRGVSKDRAGIVQVGGTTDNQATRLHLRPMLNDGEDLIFVMNAAPAVDAVLLGRAPSDPRAVQGRRQWAEAWADQGAWRVHRPVSFPLFPLSNYPDSRQVCNTGSVQEAASMVPTCMRELEVLPRLVDTELVITPMLTSPPLDSALTAFLLFGLFGFGS